MLTFYMSVMLILSIMPSHMSCMLTLLGIVTLTIHDRRADTSVTVADMLMLPLVSMLTTFESGFVTLLPQYVSILVLNSA